MSRNRNHRDLNIDKPIIYEIKLLGHLDTDWSGWLEGMTITYEGDSTVLTGKMTDQSALRGLLTKVWDLNQMLISVNRLEEPDLTALPFGAGINQDNKNIVGNPEMGT